MLFSGRLGDVLDAAGGGTPEVLRALETASTDDIRWLLPIPWVVAGVVGLVATAITGPRRYAVRQTGWVGPPGDQLDQQNDQLDQQNDPIDQQNDPNDSEETP